MDALQSPCMMDQRSVGTIPWHIRAPFDCIDPDSYSHLQTVKGTTSLPPSSLPVGTSPTFRVFPVHARPESTHRMPRPIV